MNDIKPLLDRLAETFPDRAAPLPDLMSTAHTGKRRRTRMTLVAVAAAVALVIGGGVVVGQVVGGNDGQPSPDQVALPVAPDGMRLVGMGQVVVAVPASWGTQQVTCGTPVADTVYFHVDGPVASCLPLPKDPVSSVEILPSSEAEGFVAPLAEPGERNGVAVHQGSSCPAAASCDPDLAYVLEVPAQEVVFLLRGPAAQLPLRDQILDQLRVLPRDFTTVPFVIGRDVVSVEPVLDAAGLKPSINGLMDNFTVWATDPLAGSVVRAGSAVTLLREEPLLTEGQTVAAQRIVRAYRDENPTANVRSAYAKWEQGTVDQPNVGECTSGELLQLTLFGSYPDIVTSGGPPGGDGTDGTVTRVLLTADAQTEEVCLLGVGTGSVGPDEGYTLIWAAEGEPDPTADTDPDPEPDPTSPEPAVSIDGQWTAVMTNITGNPMHRDTTFTISLGGGLMRGDDGCNDFGSYYSRSGPDRDLRFGSVESTLVGCDSTADFIDTLSQVRHVTGHGQKRYLHGENWGILIALELVGTWEDPPPSQVVDLPTSDWEPGDGGDGAGIGGVLSIDDRGCVYLDAGGTKTWTVWPKGYTAVVSQGSLHLLDAEVNEVAEEGDELFLGGGFTSDFTPLTGAGCLPEDGEVAIVQSNVDGSNS